MALRIKTIEYALPMITSDVNTGTSYTDSADMTIYIPETSSRTFISVNLEVSFHDRTTSSVNMTGWGIRGSCNSGTNWTAVTSSASVTHTAETISTLLNIDLTSEFTSRFGSGTSGTFRWGFYANYASATTVTNVSAKLYITYSFDDTGQTTRIKTVKIPIESFNGRLTNTAQAIKQTSTADNQIPQLTGTGGFLPESGITIRQIFAELWTNTLPSTTTNTALVLKVDSGGTETTFGTIAFGQQSPFNLRILYDITSIDTSVDHELFARHTAASGSYFANIGGWVVVTYEYSASSTTILNSVQVSTDLNSLPVDSLIAARHIPSTKLNIQETSITLRQSGMFLLGSIGVNNQTINLRVGSQSTYTAYANTSGTGQAGSVMIMHRFDSGANRGSGITLSRGSNDFTFQCYLGTANAVGAVSGVFFINYTSSLVGDPDAHNHTIYDWFHQSVTALPVVNLLDVIGSKIGIGFFGTESNYYISNISLLADLSHYTGTLFSLVVSAYTASDETYLNTDWFDLVCFTSPSANERCTSIVCSDVTNFFRQYAGDPRPRFMPDKLRYFKWYSNLNIAFSCAFLFTFHQISYTISGTLTNYTGSGSGIEVRFYNNATREYLGSTTSTTGGNFSWTWFDDTTGVFAEARESSTSLGRSDIWTG